MKLGIFYLAFCKFSSRMDPLVISMDGGTFAIRLITPINLPVSRSFSGWTGNFPAGPMSTAVPNSVAPSKSFTFNKRLKMSISLSYVFFVLCV